MRINGVFLRVSFFLSIKVHTPPMTNKTS
jgi:hypothetical protein